MSVEETLSPRTREAIEMQDWALDDLSKTLARQEEIGALLSTELEAQVGLLEDLEAATDRQTVRQRAAWQTWLSLNWDHTETSWLFWGLVVGLVLILGVLIVLKKTRR